MTFYGTLAAASAYHVLMGNAAWASLTYSDAQRESAMRRGARALDGRYAGQLSGTKLAAGQALQFPRVDLFDNCSQSAVPDGVTPDAIVNASYELALLELVAPNSLSPTVASLGRLTQSEAVSGAVSRSFFSPKDLAFLLGPGSPLNAFRPNVLVVEDFMWCYLNHAGRRWVASVV
jgi:hypothetical protein